MLDLAVLISGRGSNLQAIIDAIATGELSARIRLVVANKASAAGLLRAEAAGIATQVIRHRDFPTREKFDAELAGAVVAAGAEWVVLAGFMRILTTRFLDAFPMRVINIHPSLLPAFPGLDAQQQAIDYGVSVTGCTVHLVTEGMDSGPVIAQAVVPVHADDSRDLLAARILVVEHRLLVTVLRWIAAERLTVARDTVGTETDRWKVVVSGRKETAMLSTAFDSQTTP